MCAVRRGCAQTLRRPPVFSVSTVSPAAVEHVLDLHRQLGFVYVFICLLVFPLNKAACHPEGAESRPHVFSLCANVQTWRTFFTFDRFSRKPVGRGARDRSINQILLLLLICGLNNLSSVQSKLTPNNKNAQHQLVSTKYSHLKLH